MKSAPMSDEPTLLPPFQLRLLGVPDVRDARGQAVEPLLAQPKRLALLMRLAWAGEAGVTRQALLDLLWSDLDDTRARNALRQSLHFLRRHLGAEALRTTDELVVLDKAVVRTDALALLPALAADDPRPALEALAGRLADGLHVAGAERFAAWLEVERARLANAGAEAALRVALRAEADADRGEARRWAARAEQLAAGDASVALRGQQLLARLAAAEDFAARTTPAGVATVAPTRRWWQSPTAAWGAMVALVVLASAGFTVARLNATPPAVPDRVAVLPFRVEGAEGLEYLREGMVDLLAARLDGVPGLHVVDARLALRTAGRASLDSARHLADVTRKLAAAYGLTGQVRDSAGRLIVEATMYTAAGVRQGSARAIAAAESSLVTAVDDLARQLIALRGAGARDHLTALATRTTSSLDALRAWLDGEQAFRAGRYVAATDAFQRAVQLDSTFSVAYYRWAVAAAYATSGQTDITRGVLTAALRHGDRLTAHDRLMVQALFQDWHGSSDSALRLYRRAMGERPDDAEAWYGYADATFHQGPRLGITLSSSRPYFEKALALDSTNLGAITHLARIAAMEGDVPRLHELAQRERALRSPSALPGEAEWMAAVAQPNPEAVSRMVRALESATDDVASEYAWRAAGYGADPQVAIRILQPRTEGDRPQTTRAATMIAIAHFEAARARPREAARWLDRARALMPVPALLAEANLLWATQPSADAVQFARFRFSRWRTAAGISAAFDEHSPRSDLAFAASELEVALQAAIGNRALVHRFVAVAEHVKPALSAADAPVLSQIQAWTRARDLALAGDTAAALREIEQHRLDPYPRGSLIFSGAYGRLERARLLVASGRHEEALTWLATIPEENAKDAALYPAMLFEALKAHAARGDRAAAQATGQRLVRLWRAAEPTELERVEQVRRLMRGDVQLARLRAGVQAGGQE